MKVPSALKLGFRVAIVCALFLFFLIVVNNKLGFLREATVSGESPNYLSDPAAGRVTFSTARSAQEQPALTAEDTPPSYRPSSTEAQAQESREEKAVDPLRVLPPINTAQYGGVDYAMRATPAGTPVIVLPQAAVLAASTTPSGSELSPPSDSTGAVRRIPHLDCNRALPVEPGREFQVEVYADRENPRNEEQSTAVSITPSNPDTQEFEAVVYLVASQQLRVIGPGYKTIMIRRDEAASAKARFRVWAESNQDGNPGTLTALFYYKGYPCGRVRRRIPIAVTASETSTAQANQAALTEKPEVDMPSFTLSPGSPDLTITVVQTEEDETRHARYQCFVQAPHSKTRYGPVEYWGRIPKDARGYLQTQFARFSLETSGNQARAGLMESGRKLFNKAPDGFQRVLWELNDRHELPKTIFLFSDEPHIPWELMIPHRSGGDELEPLGVMSAMGRWTSDPDESLNYPLRQIRLERSLVWAPVYTTDALSTEEPTIVTGEINGDAIQPATFDGLQKALSDHNDATVLHFVCHGASAEQLQTIKGEPGDTDKDLITVEELTGEPRFRRFCLRRPLIFLNACEIGQTIQTLTGVGGFAPAFIDKNAGAVVAPLWSVLDQQAENAAKEFYKTLREHPETSFAEVIRTIRAHAYHDTPAKGLVTYAAYCFYGDPLATPTFVGVSARPSSPPTP